MEARTVNDIFVPVADLGVDARASFISRTYAHVLGAIVTFVLLEVAIFKSGYAQPIAETLLGVNWLLVLGAFIVVGWLASRVAHSVVSPAAQYAALAGFVLAYAIIFVPMLYIADAYAPGVIRNAATVTLMLFGALTGIVFYTRKDFAFLRTALMFGGVAALGLIVAGVIFGFNLGLAFSVGMVVLAGGAILYDTSNVLFHYPEDRYVGAALELFGSVALMFWYVLRIFLSRD